MRAARRREMSVSCNFESRGVGSAPKSRVRHGCRCVLQGAHTISEDLLHTQHANQNVRQSVAQKPRRTLAKNMVEKHFDGQYGLNRCSASLPPWGAVRQCVHCCAPALHHAQQHVVPATQVTADVRPLGDGRPGQIHAHETVTW